MGIWASGHAGWSDLNWPSAPASPLGRHLQAIQQVLSQVFVGKTRASAFEEPFQIFRVSNIKGMQNDSQLPTSQLEEITMMMLLWNQSKLG
uniref:Uncharacterized protein n=1 Tax=Ditylenchus dipsaci TaxID=166011 RepID=A0A915CQ23_9BILA